MASQVNSVPTEQRASRAILFVLFLIGGLAIFLFGNNWNIVFPTNDSTLYKASLPIIFLALAVVLRRSEHLRTYWRIAFALFIAAFANWLNWTLGNWLGRLLPAVGSTAHELAIDKLSQCVPVVLSIIVLTKLVGDDLGSIFLKKGDLKEGLRFGLISFGICAGIFAVIAIVQANAPASQGLTASGVSLARHRRCPALDTGLGFCEFADGRTVVQRNLLEETQSVPRRHSHHRRDVTGL